jgi:hypothetical protein
MRDDSTRVTVASWEKLKEVIPADSENMKLTPRFGYVIDNFRILYNIYISVIPIEINESNINGFRYDIYQLSNNDILNTYSGTEQAYYVACRSAISKALEILKGN